MKCATCGAKLKEVGYPVDGFQRYECPNGCDEIFSRWTKVVDTVKIVLAVIAFLFVAVILSPMMLIVWIVDKIDSVMSRV